MPGTARMPSSLQQADERDVVGDRRPGPDVEGALRPRRVVAHGLQGVAQQVALRLVLRHVHRGFRYRAHHPLPDRGRVDVSQNAVGHGARAAQLGDSRQVRRQARDTRCVPRGSPWPSTSSRRSRRGRKCARLRECTAPSKVSGRYGSSQITSTGSGSTRLTARSTASL